MSRRIVPGMFCVGLVLCSMLITTRLWASRPPARVPNLLGHWDGFFLETDDGPVIGEVRSDVTGQVHREIEGQGTLLALDSPTLLDAYHFRATVAADDLIAGAGRDKAGRLVIQGALDIFPGVQGNAGIWDPDLRFDSVRGRPSQVSATLLHPFPDANAPDIGDYAAEGPFLGLTDPTFSGTGVMMTMPLDRGSYPGTFTFESSSNLQPAFSWPVRVTTSADRQFVMIGQGKTGRMSYVGSVITQNGSPSEIWGIARLALEDGRVLYNTINFNLTSLNR
jgi:hypothetical protein